MSLASFRTERNPIITVATVVAIATMLSLKGQPVTLTPEELYSSMYVEK